MDYYQYTFTTQTKNKEVLLAFLGQLPFESFEETDTGWHAYVPVSDAKNIHESALKAINTNIPFELTKTHLPAQNWNEVWESNFQAIRVSDFCGIRADFHPPFEDVQHELLINPQMAFGTGHHETTHLMIATMERLDFTNKTVLDYGCGTGILAILAEKLGAATIEAIDIEAPAYHNTIENAALNKASKIHTTHGILDDVETADFDIILANINRHVLLDTMPQIHQKLATKGQLLLSGILETDRLLLENCLKEHHLTLKATLQKGSWLCLWVEKS